MTVKYTHPPVDSVPPQYHVAGPMKMEFYSTKIQSVEEAVAAYMTMYRTQFAVLGTKRREQNLKRFVRHLKARNHSLQLTELTQADGQAFLDELVNSIDGSELSLGKRQDYRGALRSFSRFLYNAQLMEEDVFFRVSQGL